MNLLCIHCARLDIETPALFLVDGTATCRRHALTEPSDAPASELIGVAEAARITGTTERMIRRLIEDRRLASVKVGRYVKIRREQLDAFIASNSRPVL